MKSVKDFSAEEELMQLLKGPSNLSFDDWMLDIMDETTHINTATDEFHRLQVLKSYSVLDAEREESLDQLSQMASRVFGTGVAAISMVDLGRVYLLSSSGLGDVREIPRKNAFCSYAIQQKNDVMVVLDPTTDKRFSSNALVVNAPNVRFYAGMCDDCTLRAIFILRLIHETLTQASTFVSQEHRW